VDHYLFITQKQKGLPSNAMPLQMQSSGLLPGHENNLQQRVKSVSFHTPAAKANSKKSKATGRRAFGDISNRKPTDHSAHQQKAGGADVSVTKPAANKSASVRIERKPSTSVKKPKAVTTATSKTRSEQKAQKEVEYESIERPYGLTGRELEELYDSDDHISVCSMEKEGFVVSRAETVSLIRQAMIQRRENQSKHLEEVWQKMQDETLAMIQRDGM
jgi:hypothetical protein